MHMEADADMVQERFDRLRGLAAADEKIADMKLYSGCEIYYYPSVIQWLDEGRVMTLAGSEYVLLEFSYSSDKRELIEAVTNVRNAGYIPIMAHVERYSVLMKEEDAVDELIGKGAYIQINAEALHTKFRTRSFIKNLLKEGKVHFIATDAHDTSERGPYIGEAVRYVAKKYGEQYCSRIFSDNPPKIIRGEYL